VSRVPAPLYPACFLLALQAPALFLFNGVSVAAVGGMWAFFAMESGHGVGEAWLFGVLGVLVVIASGALGAALFYLEFVRRRWAAGVIAAGELLIAAEALFLGLQSHGSSWGDRAPLIAEAVPALIILLTLAPASSRRWFGWPSPPSGAATP
jgi:hypothetical protein